MKQPKIIRSIKPPEKDSPAWKAHQSIGKFALALNRLPDAAQAKRTRLRSNPLGMIEAIF